MIILGLMLFGFPSMIIASKKGFADSRWLLALGIIGLIVVCVLPTAKSRRISREESKARREKADGIGAVLCGISVAVFAVTMLVNVFLTGFK